MLRVENEADAATKLPVENYTASWPERGKIEFRNFSVKYRPNLPYVLKNVSLQIQPSEKVINLYIYEIIIKQIGWSCWKDGLRKIDNVVMSVENHRVQPRRNLDR